MTEPEFPIKYKPLIKEPLVKDKDILLGRFQKQAIEVEETYAPHTIGAKMVEILKKHGLFGSDLDDILALVVKDSTAISEVIHKRAEGYPIELMASIWEATRTTAIEWIDEHRPKHFARSLLAGKMPPNVLIDALT